MTGQLFFNLLNPAIALVLALTFALLYSKRPRHAYLLLLAFTFGCSAIAFTLQDFLAAQDGPVLRLLTNGFFLAAVMGACSAALLRVGAPIPKFTFALIVLACAAGFVWFLFADPSVTGRILVVNATFSVLAIVTTRLLLLARPQSTVDWLFLLLAAILFAAALFRPIAMALNGLDINVGGRLGNSDYWATVQALTPVLSVIIALVFLVALALEMMSDLRSEAERDFLTGLLNRRGFDARAALVLDTDRPRRWQSAVILVDIDDFKKINDTFGHSAGDAVIAAIGSVLASYGGADLVGRMGGEEYALFYGDARRGDLLEAADAIQSAISRVRIDGLPLSHPITVSMGIHIRHQAETLSRMMASADQALYSAKVAGKNRAVMAPLPIRSVVNEPRLMSL